MKKIDKLAALLEAQGVDLEKAGGAILGRMAGGAARMMSIIGSKAVSMARTPIAGSGNFMNKLRTGYTAGRQGLNIGAGAVKAQMGEMAAHRAVGIQPSVMTPGVAQGAAQSAAPAGDALARLRATRAGTPTPAAAPPPAPAPAAAPRKGRVAKAPAGAGWVANAAMMAAPMVMGGGGQPQQQQQPAYGAYGMRPAEEEMKDVIEKVAAELPNASREERLEAIAAIAMDLGFSEELSKAAGVKPEVEKTAAVHKKIADRDIRFDKMTFGDVANYLTEQYGRPAEVDEDEKTASAKSPAREKFASLLKAALARPT